MGDEQLHHGHTQSLLQDGVNSDASFYQQNPNSDQIEGWEDGRWRVGVHGLSNAENPSVKNHASEKCKWFSAQRERILFSSDGRLYLGIRVGAKKRSNRSGCCVSQSEVPCWNRSRQTTSPWLLIPAPCSLKVAPVQPIPRWELTQSMSPLRQARPAPGANC